ncbi:hypothetical protein SS50377_22777 [Spironucleus salmonicida]|uniref:Uncharacterized protein n=1 Tax=Spironucleus salmonicida TaxID=348837 RepID=V6LDH1_9EUKA|nr:hypothetical protein SS50377_22777 [Spironucleus salmonicida]|eukprot:EST42288.1 Hypothetical protein SS50377_18156 [Spironucleus salmonicida]
MKFYRNFNGLAILDFRGASVLQFDLASVRVPFDGADFTGSRLVRLSATAPLVLRVLKLADCRGLRSADTGLVEGLEVLDLRGCGLGPEGFKVVRVLV